MDENMQPIERVKAEKPKRHIFRRILCFLLALLLGYLLAFATLFGAGYYAATRLTLSDLQKRGVAKEASNYLTDEGEVDLTHTTVVGLVKELNTIRLNLSEFTTRQLMERYGLVLPENISKLLPEDLMEVPLSELFSDKAGDTVTNKLTLSYFYQFLPEGFLSQKARAVLAGRPLSLLISGNFEELLSGVQLGYVTGVTYDGDAVVFQNPAAPTVQELLAPLDLGKAAGALLKNGDFLCLIATDLGSESVSHLLGGLASGELLLTMCEGKTLSDVILPGKNGRYGISFPALSAGVSFGTVMGYKQVDGVWYQTYAGSDNPANVPLSAMLRAVAEIELSAVMNNEFDLNTAFADLYFGDLQSGYVRGEALSDDPEGAAGFYWSENGVPVNAVKEKLANIRLADAMNGKLDVMGTLEGLTLGEAMGYTKGEQTAAADPADPDSYPKYAFTKPGAAEGSVEPVIGAALELASIPMTKLLEGKTDMSGLVTSLTICDAMNYKQVDGIYYSTYVGPDDPGNVKVTGILAVLAPKKIKEIDNAFINSVEVGEILGYTKTDGKWYKDGAKVTGVTVSLSDLTVGSLSDSAAVSAKLREVTLCDALGYRYFENDGWYQTDGAGNKTGTAAGGLLSSLMEKKVGTLESDLNAMELGTVFGYTKAEGVWRDKNGNEPTGIGAALADTHVKDVESEMNAMSVGRLMGYTLSEGIWYTDKNCTVPATGLTLSFASLTVSELNDGQKLSATIRKVKLSDAMGYRKTGAGYTDEEGNAVGGLVGALCDKEIGDIRQSVEEMPFGNVLNYTQKTDGWYDAGGQKATGLIAALCDTGVKNLPDTLQRLTLGQAFSERTGVLSMLPADTKLTELDSAMQSWFESATVGDFLTAGVVSVDATQAAGLDARIPGWREMAFAGFFGALIDAALATPTLPTT
ncbi:MAG: hypothetical protein PT951_02300 [Eubacteriales bacterium]|nr:hypothetical protein [Eubacteriales bacterium]